MSKSFTLNQVNELLPEIEKRLSVIREKKSTYMRLHDAIFVQELVSDSEKKHGADLFDSDLEADIQKLEEIIQVLADEIETLVGLGCVLRSIDLGLIDFPGQHGGTRVFFSWQYGEKAIAFVRRRGASNEAERLPLSSLN